MTKGLLGLAGVLTVAMAGTVSAQPVVGVQTTTATSSGQGTIVGTYAGQQALPTAAPALPAQPPTMVTPQPKPGQAPRLAVPPPGEPRGPQAFSVVLVVGEMQATQTGDDVPAAARKALTDLKDFLPYKHYRLLDSQWTLCCGRGPIISRLRGVADQEYELELTPTVGHTGVDGKAFVNVRFVLVEAGSARGVPTLTTNSNAELQDLERERQELITSLGEQHPKVVENRRAMEERIHALQARNAVQVAQANARGAFARGRRQVIDTSFRMEVGETVVVGTSRIQGDKALIALLTAVPSKSGATGTAR